MMKRHSGRVWLDVPYADKDQAKALGARWDPAARSWYAPRHGMAGFTHWERLPDLLPGEDRTFGGQTLRVGLIPRTSWFTNVRSAVDPRDWERLRQMVYRRADYRCEFCDAERDNPAGVFLEAHEWFSYDETSGVQTLRRLICLCTLCHRAVHFGLATLQGKAEEAEAHLRRVTGMTRAQVHQHIREAFDLWEHRNQTQWMLDLSAISAAGITLREPPSPRDEVTGQDPEAPRQGERTSPNDTRIVTCSSEISQGPLACCAQFRMLVALQALANGHLSPHHQNLGLTGSGSW